MAGKFKIDWPNHILAFLGTMLGVLFAFYLTNIQEHRRTTLRVGVATEQIQAEVRINYQTTIQHYQRIDSTLKALKIVTALLNPEKEFIGTAAQMDSIKSYHPTIFLETGRTTVNDSIFNFAGELNLNFGILQLSDIAWTNAQAMDILHQLDYEMSYELRKIYQFQQEVQEKSLAALQLIDMGTESGGTITPGQIIQRFKNQMTTALHLEKSLLKMYESSRDKLGFSIQ